MRDVAGAFARNKSDLAFHGSRPGTHDIADSFRCGCTAYRAGIHRGFSLGDGCRQRVTSRVSAGAAVVAGQFGTNRYFPFIHFNSEFLPCENQTRTDADSDDRNDQCGCQNDIHSFTPPQCGSPPKPINAMDISAAAIMTIGAPRSGAGRSFSLIRERIPASRIMAMV